MQSHIKINIAKKYLAVLMVLLFVSGCDEVKNIFKKKISQAAEFKQLISEDLPDLVEEYDEVFFANHFNDLDSGRIRLSEMKLRVSNQISLCHSLVDDINEIKYEKKSNQQLWLLFLKAAKSRCKLLVSALDMTTSKDSKDKELNFDRLSKLSDEDWSSVVDKFDEICEQNKCSKSLDAIFNSARKQYESSNRGNRSNAVKPTDDDGGNISRSSYSNLVACVHPYSPGLAATLATNLLQLSADGSYAFAAAMSTSTYSQYCQIAYGVPGDENIRMANKVAVNGNLVYWVADRGQAAVGFIERK